MAEKKEEPDKSKQAETSKKESGGGLTGPEGLLMLCVAGLLDAIGLLLFCLSWLGIDDYGILDVVGGIIIGGWLYIRNGTISGKMLNRFLIAFSVEAIPFLGNISPSWVILTWKELKS